MSAISIAVYVLLVLVPIYTQADSIPVTSTTTDGQVLIDAPISGCSNCIEARYLQHYAAKGCKAVMRTDCPDCPQRYECPAPLQVTVDDPNYYKCEYGGKYYAEGEDLDTEICQSCTCIAGYDSNYELSNGTTVKPRPVVTCAAYDCPEFLGVSPAEWGNRNVSNTKNCYYVNSLYTCCAVNASCPTDDEVPDLHMCSYRGRDYRVGQLIHPEENQCMTCLCDTKWNETNLAASNCRIIRCNIELRKEDMDQGCVPVYHEKTCCPIEYQCPTKKLTPEERKAVCSEPAESGVCLALMTRFAYNPDNKTCEKFVFGGCGGNDNNFMSESECMKVCDDSQADTYAKAEEELPGGEMTCKYGDETFGLASAFKPEPCIECDCRVPPDMTCVRRSCPAPTGPNCVIISGGGDECCPEYDCSGPLNAESSCVDDVDMTCVGINCTKYRADNGCMTCDCEVACMTPMCDTGCTISEPANECPTCVCETDTTANGTSTSAAATVSTSSQAPDSMKTTTGELDKDI